MANGLTGVVVGAGALIAGLTAGQGHAADAGTLYYPPGPPAIDSPVYAPVSLVTGDVALAAAMWGGEGESALELIGAGRINVPLQGGPWNFTGELFGAGLFTDPTETAFMGGVHAYHKNDQYAHGLYASATGYGYGGLSGHDLGVGVEGAAFMGNTTLVGRLGHYWAGGDLALDAYWKAEGIARYYLTPNTKLAGIVGWMSAPGTVMVAAGIEHLFAGTHTTGFARAAWFAGDGGSAWEVLGGAKFLFGRPGTTLQQHDWDIPFSEATVVNF